MLVSEITKACNDLQSFWTPRNSSFRDYYELITMVDKLKEEKMESFSSNEPRTFYNLALHLLTPAELHPRIPLEEVVPEDMADIAVVEKFLADAFLRIEKNSLSRGKGGFVRELVSLLLATGWYSVYSMVTDEGVVAEVWNPAEVFPEFSDDGLLRLAHIYSITGRALQRKAAIKGWKLQQSYSSSTSYKFYDYWTMETGEVQNAMVVGTELIKPLSFEPSFEALPIYCAPVAGLPDRGSIITGPEWKTHIGQSILATNSQIYTYTNKLFTFMMQLLRDTAQARWVEKSTGEAKVKPEDIFKRGAVFHLSLNETLEPVQMPVIPVELRALQFDVASMRQKGQVPDVLFGGAPQAISGYLMQQIAGATAHILKPYQLVLKFLLEELSNIWLSDIRRLGLRPYGSSLPNNELPRVEIDLRIDIPGDIVQRATVARMLDPTFTISTQTVMDMLFPEIRSPIVEQARARASRALQHPVAVTLDLIAALEEQVQLAEASGDIRLATRLRNAVRAVEAQMSGAGIPPAPTPRPTEIPEEFK